MSKKGIIILVSSIAGGLLVLGITIFAAFSLMKPADWTFRDYKNLESNYKTKETTLIAKHGKPDKTESIQVDGTKITFDTWTNTKLGKGEKILGIFHDGKIYTVHAGNSEELEDEIDSTKKFEKEYANSDKWLDDDYDISSYKDSSGLTAQDYLDILKQLDELDLD